MQLLILSCNTGEGHNSCAKAIAEYFTFNDASCQIVDSFGFISQKASQFISDWHSKIYRHAPSAFSHGYKFAEEHSEFFDEDSTVYHFLTSGTTKLYNYLNTGNFDAILCTHVLTALQLSDVIKKYPLTLKTYFVATDYTCSPTCNLSNLDYYFIPHRSLLNDFIDLGIPKDKIICTGIPVRRIFYTTLEKAVAKQLCGISPNHNHLLVMCGSMGCGPIEKITEKLSASISTNCAVSVVCGNNQKLYKKLSQIYEKNTQIHILGYVKDMSLLMDSADLYLTKPGGLSTSEAAAKKLPMVFLNAVAGCESYNLRFFIEKGVAQTADTPEEVSELCLLLLQDKNRRQNMSDAFFETFEQHASKNIYEIINSNINQTQENMRK